MPIKIYKGNKLIAREIQFVFYPEENVEQFELPIYMFGLKGEPVDMSAFKKWVKTRIVPQERLDIDKVLDDLNLDRYDYMAIAKLTQCRRIQDDYWVDFGNYANPFPKRPESDKDINERRERLQRFHEDVTLRNSK